MEISFTRFNWLRINDLVYASEIASIIVLIIAELTFSALFGLIRIPIGIYFVLFPTGYLFTSALFSKEEELDAIERIALGVGLSIALIVLTVLAANVLLKVPITLSWSLILIFGLTTLCYAIFNLRARFKLLQRWLK